jgi:hypothetical protein
MKAQLEHPADEIKRLQRCINDLVSLLALPAVWSGSTLSDIVHTLLDSLLRMLNLDFVYVSLTNLVDAAPSETVRVAQSQEEVFRPRELCTFVNRWLGDDPQKRYLQERSDIGDEEEDHQIDLATALGEDVPDVSGGPQGRTPSKRR